METQESLTQLFDDASAYYKGLQDTITRGLEELEARLKVAGEEDRIESARFREDNWTAAEGSSLIKAGGGRTRVMEGGRIFERGGVNFSDVSGEFSDEMARSMPGDSREFRASGISLVLHPRNPHAPTVHANFRVIRRGPAEKPDRLWFGGGADLTPHVLYPEDAEHFHGVWREVCGRFSDVADYPKMKAACDKYFFLPHRGESRGIGGIFYDYLEEHPKRTAEFSKNAGAAFLEAYRPILERRAILDYDFRQREFQLYRRGRYVEFNLLWDRGTQFGIRTGGRTESILMSLPSPVKWEYDYVPEVGTPEAKLLEVLRNPVDWVR